MAFKQVELMHKLFTAQGCKKKKNKTKKYFKKRKI